MVVMLHNNWDKAIMVVMLHNNRQNNHGGHAAQWQTKQSWWSYCTITDKTIMVVMLHNDWDKTIMVVMQHNDWDKTIMVVMLHNNRQNNHGGHAAQ